MVVVQCAITDRRLYWVSGILATSTSLRPIDRRLATLIGSACSGATSVLAAAFVACSPGAADARKHGGARLDLRVGRWSHWVGFGRQLMAWPHQKLTGIAASPRLLTSLGLS